MSDDRADDRALLAAHVEGEPDAFGILFARHRDRLWAVALRTTGDREEAADALQDAMVSAFRRAGGYRGDAAVTTWLHRIVVNACLDRIRRRKVRATTPLPDDLDLEPQDAPGRPWAAVDPAEVVLDHERRATVAAALAALPVEQRTALVLVDMEGFSVEEAASILRCPTGTVKSRCSRGRARLLPLLADLGPAEPTAGATRPIDTPVTARDRRGGHRDT
jgi:RNA polymerase sigma-70 factor, ECF subfamily